MTQATPTPALHAHSDAALHTPSDLGSAASRDISAALNGLLASLCAVPENKELPLASQRTAFP
jgi:hypothetical protein